MLRRIFVILLVSILLMAGVSDNVPVVSQEVSPEDIEIEVPPTVRTVEFTGNTLISTEELRQAVGIRTGQLLTGQILRQAVADIRLEYCKRGYLVAVTNITFPEPGMVGPLRFELQEVKISSIRITGLKKTREDVVRGILITEPGNFFSRREIQSDAARLAELGVFSSADPQLQFTSPGEAVLVWNLIEKDKFNYAELGGSIGQPEGLIARGSFTFANIGGRADRLRIDGYIGTLEGEAGGRLSYYNPLIAPNRTSLLLQAYSLFQYRFSRDFIDLTDGDLDPYFERRTGASVVFARPTNVNRTQAAGLRVENVDSKNLPPDFLTNTGGDLDSTVAIASLQSTIDFRDSIRYPTKGSLTTGRLEAGYADHGSGSGGISKVWADKRWLVSFREARCDEQGIPTELIPTVRLQAAAGTTFGDLPFAEQFFVGGISAFPLRGYPEDRFWGKNMVLAGVEYRYPFNNRFIAVAFVDAGDAWDSDYQFIESPDFTTDFRQHRSFSPKVGVGVGARYFLGNTPLAVDFAYGEEFRIHFTGSTSF